MAYIQHGNPFKKADPRRTIGPGKNFNKAKPTGTGGAAGGAKRRKSFCARSRSWTSERGKAARRRWNC